MANAKALVQNGPANICLEVAWRMHYSVQSDKPILAQSWQIFVVMMTILDGLICSLADV